MNPRWLLLACLLTPLGCSTQTAPLSLPTKPDTTVEPATKPERDPSSPKSPTTGASTIDFTPPEYPDFAKMARDAEPLPPTPKADPKSVLKPLQPDNSLILETLPDGRRRLLLQAEVCLDRGPLEVFLCKSGTKEHEAILRTAVPAQFIHAALIAAGAEKGSPVQFVDPKTGEEAYRPASGDRINVLVNYTKGGKNITRPAQEWIRDNRTDKPMTHSWVFAGSRFVKNPDAPDQPEYYTANNGEYIGISNFPDSMLDLPVAVSQNNDDLSFEARTVELPPVLSKVWLILEPATKPKKP